MKTYFSLVIIISVLFIRCVSWKQVLLSKGTENDAIKNALADFLHSGKSNNKDTVFFIYRKDLNSDVLGISISTEQNKIAVITEDGINYSYKAFPTNYIEQNGKLFYWKDSTQNVSTNLISILYKMNRVDTAIVGKHFNFPRRGYDDSKKAMHYYFCRNNFRIYKKTYTRTAMGWYEVPELNCH